MSLKKILFNKYYSFFTSIGLTLIWGIFGFQILEGLIGKETAPIDREINKMIAKVMKEDPEAANQIAKIRENREVNNLGLLSAMKIKGQIGGTEAVGSMLKSNSIPLLVRLCSLANNENYFRTDSQRQEFLSAHATTLEMLEKSGAFSYANDYMDKLEVASKDPSKRATFLNDSLGLLISEQVTDPILLSYYEKERDQDWLEDSLMSLVNDLIQSDNFNDDLKNLLNDYLKVAHDFHPTFKEAAINQSLRPFNFDLFNSYGKVIEYAVKQNKLDLEETMEVVLANRDFFDDQNTEGVLPDKIAAGLSLIKNGKPTVWAQSRISPLTLRLDHEVPDKSERLLKKFRSDDIAGFLFGNYEDEIIYAADALDKFDDLALLILLKYKDTTGFKDRLKQDIRIIPYMATFGNAGLERLQENREWMYKYFDKNGKPLKPDWWVGLPIVGAPLNIFKNAANGTPSEWSELGWAAIDVVDGVLLIATIGGTTAAKVVVKETGEELIETTAKKTAKSTILAATKAIAGTSKQGSRLAARKASQSMMKRLAAQVTKIRLVRITLENGSKVWRIATSTTRRLVTPLMKVMDKANDLKSAWKSISPSTRRIVYRSVLACGLILTIQGRTIPILREKIEIAMETIKDTIAEVVKACTDIANLRLPEGEFVAWIYRHSIYYCTLGALIYCTWRLRPFKTGLIFG